MFKEYDTFRLAKRIVDEDIPIGTIGVVLAVYPGEPNAYEVEFCDASGKNLGSHFTYTLNEDYLSPSVSK